MGFSIKDMISIRAIHILFNSDEYLLQFFFDHKKLNLRGPTSLLLEEAQSLSSTDGLLISIAIDVWNGESNTPLNKILTELNEDAFLDFLQAVAYKKELIEAWESLSCLN